MKEKYKKLNNEEIFPRCCRNIPQNGETVVIQCLHRGILLFRNKRTSSLLAFNRQEMAQLFP